VKESLLIDSDGSTVDHTYMKKLERQRDSFREREKIKEQAKKQERKGKKEDSQIEVIKTHHHSQISALCTPLRQTKRDMKIIL
jgi:hypothetical protein